MLAPSWDYLHPGVLKLLISNFGSEKDKKNLRNYSTYWEKFLRTVTVGDIVWVCNNKPEHISEFCCINILAVMNPTWETATLQEVENLRVKVSMHCSCPELFKAVIVRSSIGIFFSIPFWINLNLERLIPLLHSKGAVKVFLNERCIFNVNKKVSITCKSV